MRDLPDDNEESTIVACATPIAPSAISVIRISGAAAGTLLKQMTGLDHPPHGVMKKCTLCTGELKDSVMAAMFYSPKSYTGEDSAELYTHGSPIVVKSVIKFCLSHGARLAEGGEFTRRAYLNGKLDLSGAEGVNDIIHAETVGQVNAAYSVAEGNLYKKCKAISDKITAVAAALTAGLDYPEEGVELGEERNLKNEINAVEKELTVLTDSYDVGRKIGEGIRVVLTGKVNAGKSSLFNALLGSDRAIVDESEGTTRDSIDAVMEYCGAKYLLTDTAGLRMTDDGVENKGIDRAKKLVAEADIVIEVLGKDDKSATTLGETIKVRPRADEGITPEDGELSVSSKTGAGIDALKEEIRKRVDEKGLIPKSDVIVNYRHYAALKNCLSAIEELAKDYDFVTEDIKTVHLRDALDELGKITGLIGSEEVLDEVFASFCVGK